MLNLIKFNPILIPKSSTILQTEYQLGNNLCYNFDLSIQFTSSNYTIDNLVYSNIK